MTLYHENGKHAATAPFDFQKSLAFIENFEPTEGEQEVTPTSFTKAIAMHGYTVAFRVSNAGTLETPAVAYELFSEKRLPAAVKQAVVERIAFFLSLNDDLRPFYAIGKADPAFAPIIDRLYGLHHIKFLTLHEAACWAVITQHTAIPIAAAIKRALIERYGSSITVDGSTYWAFPELERLMSLSIEELTPRYGDWFGYWGYYIRAGAR